MEKSPKSQSVLEITVSHFHEELVRLQTQATRTHLIAESLLQEAIEPAKAEAEDKINGGIMPKLQAAIQLMTRLNNSIEANLNRVASFTGE